jgi:hypothetical protein
MDTVRFQKGEKGVKCNAFIFVFFKQCLEDFMFVIFQYKIHADSIDVGFELFIGEGIFFIFVEILKNCVKLSLKLLINQTFFEFHYLFYKESLIILTLVKYG